MRFPYLIFQMRFSNAIPKCDSQMRFPNAIPKCDSQMRFPKSNHLVPKCDSHIWFSKCSFRFLRCLDEFWAPALRFSLVSLLLWRGDVMHSCQATNQQVTRHVPFPQRIFRNDQCPSIFFLSSSWCLALARTSMLFESWVSKQKRSCIMVLEV